MEKAAFPVVLSFVRCLRSGQSAPVATRRDTKRAYESFREVGLRGEAALKRDVGYRRLVGREKLLRPLQSHHGQILVNGMTGGLLERAGKVVLAQACYLRQLIQAKLALEIRVNEFTDTLQPPWIESPSARWRRSVAVEPRIFVNQSRRKRAGQPIGQKRAISSRRLHFHQQ